MQILDRLAVVDILNWVRDNMGMELAIVTLAIIVAAIVISILRKRPKSEPANITHGNHSPIYHVGGNLILKAEQDSESKPIPEPPALPEHRAWRELMSGTERIEQAAGFRAAGPIYYTPGLYPRFYIMHASARVFRPGGEEYYDAKGETQYILLRHDAPGDMPYRVRPHGITDLEALYKRASDSNARFD